MSRMNINGCIGDLTPFPGCGQIIVSHNVFLPPHLRGKGHGGKAHKERLNVMHNLGFDYALATVLLSNVVERGILATNGWVALAQFKSSRSGDHVILYGRFIGKSNSTIDDRFAQPVGAEYYDHVDQRQQFQNVDREDGGLFGSWMWPNDAPKVDSETAIHEEIQRVRQET